MAAKQFVKHHVGMLPVINAEGKLVGVLQLRDLLTLILPSFTNLMDDFDFVSDFGAMESIQPSLEIVTKQVSEVMEPPVCVDEMCGLSRAFALLHHHNLTVITSYSIHYTKLYELDKRPARLGILLHWSPDRYPALARRP